MNLMQASQQWADRPADERYWTLEDMQAAANELRRASVEAVPLPIGSFRVRAEESGDLTLFGQKEGNSRFSHFSLGQLCNFIAPDTDDGHRERAISPDGLRRFGPAKLAELINMDIAKVSAKPVKPLWLKGSQVSGHAPGVFARAFNGPKYSRIWNNDIISRLIDLKGQGFRVPPARPSSNTDSRARQATPADCLDNVMAGLGIKPGDMIAPAGLYMGEKDMFAFMVNEGKQINAGGGTSLKRGFFVGQSELGDESFWLTTFGYNDVCGNHIVWGASNVVKIEVRHVGRDVFQKTIGELRVKITEYANSSVSDIEAKIARARIIEFGKDKPSTVDFLYGKRINGLGRNVLESAYDAAVKHPADGGNAAPTSAWGMVQGLTRLSQASEYAEKRVELDVAASKVLALAK